MAPAATRAAITPTPVTVDFAHYRPGGTGAVAAAYTKTPEDWPWQILLACSTYES